jgi:hypothetical protein
MTISKMMNLPQLNIFKKFQVISLMLLFGIVFSSCNSAAPGEDDGIDNFVNVTLPGSGSNSSGTGDGGIGNSAIQYTPSSYDFGDVGVGGSATHTFTIENTSSKSIYLKELSGQNATFSVDSTDCPLGGVAFAAAETCTVDIDFAPPSGGDHTINLNLLYDLTFGGSGLIAPLGLEGSAGANAPSNYQLTNITGTTATISWSDNSNNETHFEVQRCDGLTCASSFVSASSNNTLENATTYQFTGLTEGNYYRFRVRAVTSTSQSDWLEGTTVLSFGGIASVDDNGTGTTDLSSLDCRVAGRGAYVKMSWAAVPNASAYFVYDKTGGANTLLKTLDSSSTSTIITGLELNTSYDLLVTVATTTGFNSLNSDVTSITTTNYTPCVVLGKDKFNDHTDIGGLHQPYDVQSYGGKFFVLDKYSNRLVIYNSAPSSNSDLPNVVVGQSSLTEAYVNNTPGNIGSVSAYGLYNPSGFWVGSVGGSDKLMIADTNNHRVLIWNSIPTTNHAPADVVIGQGDMISSNIDGTDVARGVQNPWDVFSDGTKVYVADYNNHRVLIWNTVPTTNFIAPNVYLGQTSNTDQSNACNVDYKFRNPRSVWSDGSKLFVANSACHRVSVYDSIPTTNTQAPNTSICQASLTTSSTSKTATTCRTPTKVKMVGTKLLVADSGNHRIKVWNSLPASGDHGVASDFVVGDSNTNNGNGSQQWRLNSPTSFAMAGTTLYVADTNNARVVGHTTFPTGDASNAAFQIGQEDWNKVTINNYGATSAKNFDDIEGIAWDGTQFFVADPARNRVMVWNGTPTSNNQDADFVIGQGNFLNTTSGRSQSQLSQPRGICTGGGKLWVPDTGNRRVMVFDLPISSNMPAASAVLGVDSWTTRPAWDTGKSSVNQAWKCFYDGTKFYVIDRQYDRVLIWNSLPSMSSVTDNPAADVQVGTAAGNKTSQNGLYDPNSLYSDGTSLYIVDSTNNRIMVWNTIPTTDDANADFLLGTPPDWTSRPAGTSIVDMSYPRDITGDGSGKIYVLDDNNERILVFNSPSYNQEPASGLYGKSSYLDGLHYPDHSTSLSGESKSFVLIGNRIFVSDTFTTRIIGFPVAP